MAASTDKPIHASAGAAPDAELRLALHRDMMRIRRVEEEIVRLYPEQEIRCPTHICIGQEAVPVAVSAHLGARDYVFSGHRSHGHYLAKGGDLKAMMAELFGRETGCALGRGGSQHLIDLDAGFVASAPILAGTVPIGVGAAWGARRRGEDRVSVVYIGDGATEEGAYHEALNFASVNALPVVFVCENNLYSVHSAMDIRQPAGRSIADGARGHAIAAQTIDGNDVSTVWAAAADAVAHARSGKGPRLIECMTYRWLEHCGPNGDVALGYRSEEELAEWQARCPLVHSEAALRADGLLDNGAIASMEAEIKAEIAAAVAFARQSPMPRGARYADFTYPAVTGA